MTTKQVLIAAFAVLLIGLALPVGHGVRSAIFLALIALLVLTLLGGGMGYFLSFFS